MSGTRVGSHSAIVIVSQTVPARGDAGVAGGVGDHVGESDTTVPRGLSHRSCDAASAGGHARPCSVAARLAWTAVGSDGHGVRRTAVCRTHVRLRLMSVLGEHVARDLRQELYGHICSVSASRSSRARRRAVSSHGLRPTPIACGSSSRLVWWMFHCHS